ncbi:hypothetical protein HEP_00001600 [Hepatocystis sp. ex Piliocolobus tephrosceles]|nr:hypothetical protein HEP_00001600 [Hepatocystis sp. ex Piliocolobus tephrosceles]
MKLQQFLFFNALLYSSCVLSFKTKVSFRLTETSASLNEEANSEEVNSAETHSQEATGSSITKLYFTNKNDFVETSKKIYILESNLSLTYLHKLGLLNQSVKKKFIHHILVGESINKESYDRENAILIDDIKTEIKRLLRISNISYAKHKINSMAYRIFQRITDFLVFYNGNLSLNDIILKEQQHTFFWLHQISSALGNTNLHIRDYYIRIKERIDNDSVIKNRLIDEIIHNISCRIMQFLSDLVFIDSSDYIDLVEIL